MEKEVLSYEEFVFGLANGTVKFEVDKFSKIPKRFHRFGSGKLIVLITAMTMLPVISIPVFCYFVSKWILLFGFFGIIVGLMVSGINSKTSNPLKNFLECIFYFALLPVVLLYFLGLQNVFCFISICFYYQYFFLTLGDIVHDSLFKKYLLVSPDNYYQALESKSIVTYRINN